MSLAIIAELFEMGEVLAIVIKEEEYRLERQESLKWPKERI
jgi:hypothetical protein